MNEKKKTEGALDSDNDPRCGIGILSTTEDDIFIRACSSHDGDDLLRQRGEPSLSAKENDNRLDIALHLLAKNYPYPERSSGFAKWWNTRRADLFSFLARSYTRWFRRK